MQSSITKPSRLMCDITSFAFFWRQCVITNEDTHESESRMHVDQDGHNEEVEDLLSLRGFSRVKIRSCRNKYHYELRVGVREGECRCCANNQSPSGSLLSYGARLLPWQTITIRNQHDDPGVTAKFSGSWRWASSELQVDDKDEAIEFSGVVEFPEWNITPKHLVGEALRSDRAE